MPTAIRAHVAHAFNDSGVVKLLAQTGRQLAIGMPLPDSSVIDSPPVEGTDHRIDHCLRKRGAFLKLRLANFLLPRAIQAPKFTILALLALVSVPAFCAPFGDNGNGTVTDTKTGLVWMRCSVGQSWNGTTCVGTAPLYSWTQAMALTSNYAGYVDWRLPSISEVGCIYFDDSIGNFVNPGFMMPLDAGAFPNFPGGLYWSSSEYGPTSTGTSGWMASGAAGYGCGTAFKDESHPVLLVRGSMNFEFQAFGAGMGFGDITSTESPKHVQCSISKGVRSGSCGGREFPGTTLLLTATPNAGSIFTGWSGDCSGTDTCQVTMHGPIRVAATFIKSTLRALPLNDSGIQFCQEFGDNSANCAVVAADTGTHPRQDARFGRDALAAVGALSKIGAGSAGFDYTKISNSGADIPSNSSLGLAASDWGCTRDNVTGLIWEIKRADGSLRDVNWRYSKFDRNPATNGGSEGMASGGTCLTAGRCDTEKYVDDVNAAGLCGANDWRMPTVRELLSIVHYGNAEYIDVAHFPNSPSTDYWTITPWGAANDAGWLVSGGAAWYLGNSYTAAVRLVRGGH